MCREHLICHRRRRRLSPTRFPPKARNIPLHTTETPSDKFSPKGKHMCREHLIYHRRRRRPSPTLLPPKPRNIPLHTRRGTCRRDGLFKVLSCDLSAHQLKCTRNRTPSLAGYNDITSSGLIRNEIQLRLLFPTACDRSSSASTLALGVSWAFDRRLLSSFRRCNHSPYHSVVSLR